MTSAKTVDVLIIGMGPVGKMAALLLARAGHSVLVTERKKDTYALPRAVAHDAEIARLLQHAGMPVDTIPDAVEPYDDLYVWVNAHDEVLHQVDWTGIDPSGWNNTYFYNQPALEAHLDSAVHQQPTVEILRGVIASVRGQDDDGVDVVVSPVAGESEELTVRARYVLGADGAGSATRGDLGIEWNDLGYFFDWLVIDVIPGPGVQVTHLAKQVCDPARPTTVVPGGPGRRRWEFMRLEGESVEELVRPERIWQLLEPFGVRPDNSELERGVVYTFNSGWAAQWQDRRVFLLGDAAHQMPPFAGQGLAAGFRDCLNLVWKLDLVLRGAADAELLSTYQSERMRHVADFIDFSMSLGKIICITDPDAAAARDEAMIAELASGREPEAPPAPRLGSGAHTGDHGGVLSRQGRITADGHPHPVRFDDVFGSGALVLRGGLALDESASNALAQVGIAVTSFGGADGHGAFVDVDGSYGDWFDALGIEAVLIRSDFYVFGTATGPESLDALVAGFLDRISGSLKAGSTAAAAAVS